MKVNIKIFLYVSLYLFVFCIAVSCNKYFEQVNKDIEQANRKYNVDSAMSKIEPDTAFALNDNEFNPFMYYYNFSVPFQMGDLDSEYYMTIPQMQQCKSMKVFETWTENYIQYRKEYIAKISKNQLCVWSEPFTSGKKILKRELFFNKKGQIKKNIDYETYVSDVGTETFCSYDVVYDKNDMFIMEIVNSDLVDNSGEKAQTYKKIPDRILEFPVKYDKVNDFYTADAQHSKYPWWGTAYNKIRLNANLDYIFLKFNDFNNVHMRYEYTYDKENRISKMESKVDLIVLRYKNNLPFEVKYESEIEDGRIKFTKYDENGVWLEKEIYGSDGSLYMTVYREIEYWDE